MAQLGYEEDPSDPAAASGPAYAGIPPRNNDAALFVGGLSFSATEEDLRNVRLLIYIFNSKSSVGIWFCR